MDGERTEESAVDNAKRGKGIPKRLRDATVRRIRPSIAYEAGNVLLLTAGALLTAFGFNLFLVPGNVAPGGITGLTLAVSEAVPLPVPPGMLMLILNVPLLYLGYRSLGGARFMLRTVYTVVVMTISIDLIAPLVPPEGITDDALLNALYGGALLGVATALVLRAFGNVGGTAILARVIQRRSGAPIGQIYLLIDGLIVMGLGVVFGWERALYSMVALFISGMVTDYAAEGPSIIRTVFIITDKPREVAAAVQVGLRTGVTAWVGEGMYRGGERTVLFCTVNRAEVREVMRLVREIDPVGFVVVGQGHSASGGTIGRSSAPG